MKFLLSPNKRIYFASDLHLMMAPDGKSRSRERDFVQWLDAVKSDAAAVFLLGDIFDFWFEYKQVVPRGFVRLFGKLAELTDSGIPVHFFAGNHDQWILDYLSSEMNISTHRKPEEFDINGKRFLIGHGHDVGIAGFAERALHSVFDSRFLRVLYASFHPFWGVAFGKNWSKNSRRRHGIVEPFKGLNREFIYLYAKKILAEKHCDFFVFGHRHLAMDVNMGNGSRYINTGEWLQTRTYAVFDGNDVTLHSSGGKTEFLRL